MRLSLRLPAPSSTRLFAAACSLTACLLLLPHPARAGTYVWQTTDPSTGSVTAQSPALSGGTLTGYYWNGLQSYSYYFQGYPVTNQYGIDGDKGGPLNCSGAITTLWTWQPAPGQTAASDPAPASVVVQETCTAKVRGTNGTTDPVTGVCDTGVGVSCPLTLTQIWSAAECTGTRYRVVSGGPTVRVTCSPQAQCSGLSDSVHVRYTPAIFPVTISLTGTTKDSSGNQNILIGQGCTGSLSTAAPVTFSNYQWSAGGAVFDQFQVASDQSWGHTTPVSSDQWQQPNPYWHYLQYDSGPFAVTCSATVSVGGTAIGTVQGQQNVQVWAPYYYMGANVGPCTIVNNVVQAGGVDIQTQPGINFTGRVGTPALFTTSGVKPSVSAGSWAFLQLCKLDESINSSVWPSKTLNTGGYELDNIWPYWNQYIANSTDANPNSASAPDSPAVGLDTTTDNIVINDDFQMYMMYLPPGSNSQWVPLDRLTWHWDVNSSEVGSQWIPTPPGSVIADPDQKWMVHPEWTSRHGNSVATL